MRIVHAATPTFFGAFVALALALQAGAEDSSSWWNPFSGRESSASGEQRETTARASDAKPKSSLASFPSLPKPSLPKLRLPGSTTPREVRSKQPSTWDKMTAGTKSFFAKTKNVLMPWASDSEQPARKSSTGARRTTRPSAASRGKTAEKSTLSSWFQSEPEQQQIESANDFLKLPRPYE